MIKLRYFALLAGLLVLASCAQTEINPQLRKVLTDSRPGDRVGFVGDISPILRDRCLPCHNAERATAGVDFSSSEAMMAFSPQGPLIVPGEPLRSRLFQVVVLRDDAPYAMPPTGHALTSGDVSLLRDWIRQGADWPDGEEGQLKPNPGSEPRSR